MPKLTTPLCRMLGITAPILQAPVASSPDLAIAVSQAGGLGILPITWAETDTLRQTLAMMRTRTAMPFAANIVIPLMDTMQLANLDLTLDAGIPVVSTFYGDPSPLIPRIHDAGALAMHTVGSAEEARRVVDQGVDIVVAQGIEAGGHVWGTVATMVLVPAVVDAVPATPVVAAGGIADGRGLAAILTLGAQAAWIGTRLLLARESDAHPAWRERVVAARETDTVLSEVFDGGWPDAPHRCLLNDTLEAWHAAGEPPPGERPNEGEVIGHDGPGAAIERYSIENPTADTTGAVTSMALYAGQSAGLARGEETAAEIMATMVEEAESILGRLGTC
ncbi:MAG: nitronate monooxygenase [bacterium]|nr:nitronate monooxygenase [bacterium]